MLPRTKTLLDRLDDFFGKWYDKLAAFVESKDQDHNESTDVQPATYKWWFVANRVTTGMVITDEARCIVIAPMVWNRFVGMTLDVLLGQVRAQRPCRFPGRTRDRVSGGPNARVGVAADRTLVDLSSGRPRLSGNGCSKLPRGRHLTSALILQSVRFSPARRTK